MIMGGERHGQWVDLFEGQRAFLDIRSAETYPIRVIHWVAAPTDGGDGSSWKIALAVHPSLTVVTPAYEQEQVQGALFRMALTYWMVEFGEEESGAAAVPSTPAALFGADGNPIPTDLHEPAAGEE
jgi:hypothetical protein